MKHETYIAIIIGTYSVISLFGQEHDTQTQSTQRWFIDYGQREARCYRLQDHYECCLTASVILELLKACFYRCSPSILNIVFYTTNRTPVLTLADFVSTKWVLLLILLQCVRRKEKDAHSARPGEVSALPHLAAEQLHINTLYVLRRDL